MAKKRIKVISLGGSLIVPDKIDVKFLKEFKKVLKQNLQNYKFIVVCGGGSTARKYGSALSKSILQQHIGIEATRINARLVSYFFYNEKVKLPVKLRRLKRMVKKNDVVFCGALEINKEGTTDSTSAEIASYFKTDLINLTNIMGLYDKNPKQYKNTKFIPEISWEDFSRMANKIKFKPGQHFVLDQMAAEIIQKKKITTYILGKSMPNLNNLLKGKKFKGTVIEG